MTITEARLVKFDVSQTATGRVCDVEIDCDFTGVYDSLAAAATTSVTPVGMSAFAIAWGSQLGSGSGIYLRDKRTVFKTNSTSELSGEFTFVLRFEEGAQLSENPLSRKDQIAWNRAGESTPIFKDADDKPIVTAAKEVFAALPTVVIPKFSCTITGYRSDYTKVRFSPDKYNVINSDALNLKGISVLAKKARYMSCQTREERINGVDVIAYTWQLDFKDDWDINVLHAGNYELVSGKSVRIKDSLGLMRQSPWPLTAAGVALPDSYGDADVNYRKFKATVEINFGATFGWSF